jgi:hypothetical protein
MTDHMKSFVSIKLQCSLSKMETYCEHWNIKINEENTQEMYCSHRHWLPESHLTVKGWNNPFVNNIKYFSVIFDRKITWRLHIGMIKAKAFKTLITVYSLFKKEQLSANI